MLELDSYIKLDSAAIKSSNLCERFSKEDLQKIGNAVHEGYLRDKQSRYKWEKRTQAAMDLALQVVKEKSFPWPNAANVAFPLVTIAALQFSARSYPAIIEGNKPAKYRVIGEDLTGEKTARADRISTHMSWQCMEEDKAWEEQKDRLLISLPIVGTVFTKEFHDAQKEQSRNETVFAQDLVFDYYAKSVESCPRKTHIIPMFRNDLHSRMKRKIFRDVSGEAWYGQPPVIKTDQNTAARDQRTGLNPPRPDEQTPFTMLEQHVHMDLDDDGYYEPYIITIEENSKEVLRIVTGFDREEDIERTKEGEIIQINALQYFTEYIFIPNPDGGVLGIGFGILLGPLNESVNSLVNILLDGGTMSNAAGGFLGRGAKLRGGVYTFAPLEWKRIDSTGDDIRKNIFPLPVRDPSAVLFQLLSLLINYVQRISGTTDPMVGEPTGQNTPAETTRSMVSEGMKIYSAVFKRIWRSMKEEFRKKYIMNAIYLPRRKSFGKGQVILREDYLESPDEIAPSADPNVVSDQMALQLAGALKQAAAATPGYDPEQVERRWLKALKVDNIDQVYPGIKKTGVPKSEKIQIAEMKLRGDQMQLQSNQQQFVIQMQAEMQLNNAEIAKIAAEIENMKATTEGDKADRHIGMLNAILGAMKLRNETLTKHIDVEIKKIELERARVEAAAPEKETA